MIFNPKGTNGDTLKQSICTFSFLPCYNDMGKIMETNKKVKEDIKKDTEKKVENTTNSPKQTSKQESEKLLLSWTAPARPFKRRDKDFWTTVIVITLIVGLILFFAEGFMPVILIISIIFLYYILSTVEPESIQYKITTWGIKMADKLSPWGDLNRFWFTKRFNDEILVFEAYTIGGRLEVVINGTDREKIKDILSKYLLFEKAPPSILDKAANWFTKKLPGLK